MTNEAPTAKTLSRTHLGKVLKFCMEGAWGYSNKDKGPISLAQRPIGKIAGMVSATLLTAGLSVAMIAGTPSLGQAEPANHQMDGLTAEQERYLEVQRGLNDMIVHRFDLGFDFDSPLTVELMNDRMELDKMLTKEEFTPEDMAKIDEVASFLTVLGRDALKNEQGTNTPKL
jgi:hypothetical protein